MKRTKWFITVMIDSAFVIALFVAGFNLVAGTFWWTYVAVLIAALAWCLGRDLRELWGV